MNLSLHLPVHFLLIVHSFSSACAQHHSVRLESLCKKLCRRIGSETHKRTLQHCPSLFFWSFVPIAYASLTVLAVFKRPAVFASHRFPQRTLLDALVQSASMNSCKHSQRTQQHNRLRLSSRRPSSSFALFQRDACFPAQTTTSLPTSNCAFSLFDLRAHVLTLTCTSSSQYSRPSAPCDNAQRCRFPFDCSRYACTLQ